MNILIVYDVNTSTAAGRKRLRHVAKCCKNYGQRVQNSVFECQIEYHSYPMLKHALEEIIDIEADTIRIYNLGKNYQTTTEQLGRSTSYDFEGDFII